MFNTVRSQFPPKRTKNFINHFIDFHKVINIAPNICCISCTKLFYAFSSDLSKEYILRQWQNFSEKLIYLCGSCHGKLKCGNIPPQSLLNKMNVENFPEEPKGLNTEQHLISSVHSYLKLFVLNYEQSAINGQNNKLPIWHNWNAFQINFTG